MANNYNLSHGTFPYRLKIYGHEYYEDDTRLLTLDKIKSVIYAKKLSSASFSSYVSQSGIKSVRKKMTIFTRDHLYGVEIDDFVILGGERWLIRSFNEEDLSDTKTKNIYKGYAIELRC